MIDPLTLKVKEKKKDFTSGTQLLHYVPAVKEQALSVMSLIVIWSYKCKKIQIKNPSL